MSKAQKLLASRILFNRVVQRSRKPLFIFFLSGETWCFTHPWWMDGVEVWKEGVELGVEQSNLETPAFNREKSSVDLVL